MTLTPRHRKFWLTVHLACSIGWVGAVAAYLVLDLQATAGQDPRSLRAAHIAMEQITWGAVVPLAFASLATGLLMSLGTKWGLFRHWWVVVSFLLTVLAVTVLLVETQTIHEHAQMAADPDLSDDDLRAIPGTLVHSVGGLGVLLVVLVLNIYKPKGLTPYGWRKQQAARKRDGE